MWPSTRTQNITAAVLVDVLRALRRHVRGPLILIWDRLATHRARSTQAFLDRCPQIHPVLLPPYAPELNAVEYVWGYFKGGPLANHARTTPTNSRAPRCATRVRSPADNACFADSFASRACPCASAVLGKVTPEPRLGDVTPAFGVPTDCQPEACGSRGLE